ncbi:hypothetical protein KI387_000385, partial [Taxus chinensis]
VKGAAAEGGKGPSIWDTFSRIPGKIENGQNADVAVDQYHRYKEDVQHLKYMGVDTYRFSISWPRIFPSIEPFVTLYHWDVPQALEDEYGGFLSSKVVEDVAVFAEKCFEEFGDRVKKTVGVKATPKHIAIELTETERCLHQMMFADRDYERVHSILLESRDDTTRPIVTMQNCVEKGYSFINIKSKDIPKLLFDTIFPLTDMQYVVFHGTVDSDGPDAFQEYYIRHMDGCPVNSEEERKTVGVKAAPEHTAIELIGTERHLHQMMFADRDYERVHSILLESRDDTTRPIVTVQNCVEKGYSFINIKSKHRPKLLFDMICPLTDMQYVVFNGTVDSDGPDAFQEYYIRHMDGCPVNSKAKRKRIIHCLEAAIERRMSEGMRLELCSCDRV